MQTRKLSVPGFILVFTLLGMLPFPTVAQRQAKTMDEYIAYERDFLHVFFPELSGKKYWVTFETAEGYEPLPGYENAGKNFFVDIGDGPKSQELMCCVGGSVPGVLGSNTPQSKPVPLSAKPEPLNLGPHGEVYPKQYLRATFGFDSDGRLFVFGKLPNKPPNAEPDFLAELEQHPDISDADLAAAYKKSGAKYALGDRETFKQDLAIPPLEQFLGKLQVLKINFLPTENPRIDSLGGFSDCEVYLKGPEERDYVAVFDGFSGQLVSVSYVSDRDKKFFYPDFNRSKAAPD